jgi:hypothetical protein
VTKTVLVVTTIAGSDHPIMAKLAQGALAAGIEFIAAGDTKSPARFDLPGCRFLSIEGQIATGFSFAQSCPTRHYARKNVGYLEAIRLRAGIILETDDDNIPRPAFFAQRQRKIRAARIEGGGWANLYRYFTPSLIWPRGLPLDAVNDPLPPYEDLAVIEADCPVQQGLADANPDVDAVYRLLLPLPLDFRADRRVALGAKSWCPFNSQNTAWWPDAFPLLYLPAYCSFRMTDIWRSFVAQRICWENGWHVLFHEATVHQERNEHDLMRDFADEIPGYLGNRRIGLALEALPLKPGKAAIADNLRLCYRKLAEDGHVGAQELPLLECWLADLKQLGQLA